MDTSRFVLEVLTPLVTGTTLTVHGPLDADDVEELVEHRGALAGIAELGEARRKVAARFLYDAEMPPLEADAIRLGAAIHNLCWLLAQKHKEEQRGTMGRIATYTSKLALLAQPADEAALCARHAIVDGLRTLTRHDVIVRFWAGEQAFLGEKPPQRLLRWNRVRRVREEHVDVKLLDEALSVPSLFSIVAALLSSSPLTDLLFGDRSLPQLDLHRAARWLATPHIARAVADAYLVRGLAAVEAGFVTPLVALYNKAGAEEESAVATSFHSHLHLLDVLARAPRDREGHLQILRGYTQGRERAVADGFGLHAAAERAGLGRPSDLALDPVLERNVVAYGEACAELVGTRRLNELLGVMTRGTGAHARVA